ncbi:hypothetical protein [Acinetobacter soli]|uniref:hypothetical protein n=1 Tax=Acinetobacter soli TaxID=487316 RepID=UPI0013C34992|nr:hypothetical protein [Acinetobacter soli]
MSLKKENPYKVEENQFQDETIKIEKLFKLLSEMPPDFCFEERKDEPPREREDL